MTFSNDQGATWGTEKELLMAGVVESFSARLDKAGQLHVAWRPQGDSDPYRFFFSRSGNGGATWSTAELVAETEDMLTPGAIISDGAGRIMLCYEYLYGRYTWEKYFCNKTDGSGWEELSDARTAGLNSFVLMDDGSLVVGGGYMNLPYMYKAMVARTTDWGSTWSNELFANRYEYCRSLTCDGFGPLNAVMQLDSDYAVIRSLDRGLSWGNESIISDSPRSDNPPLAVIGSDGALLVFWKYESDIFMARGE